MSFRSSLVVLACWLVLPAWAVDTGLQGVVGAEGVPEARIARVATGASVSIGETIIAMRRTGGDWAVTRTWADVLAFLHDNADARRFVASVRRVDGGIAEVLVERTEPLPPLDRVTSPPPIVTTPPPVGTVTPPDPERIVPPPPSGLEFKGRGSVGAAKPVGVSVGSFFLSSGTLRKHQRDNFAITLSYALMNDDLPTLNETSLFAMFAGYKSRDDVDRASVGLTLLGLQVLGGFGMGYAGIGAGVAWTSVKYDNYGTDRATDFALLGRIGTFFTEERTLGVELGWVQGPRNANRGLLLSVGGRF